MITDSRNRLALIPIGELTKIIMFLQNGTIPEDRRQIAGIPPIEVLRIELLRREFEAEGARQ